MTALSVLQQVQAGCLDLSAPVDQYIPGFVLQQQPTLASTLSVADTLKMTGGFSDYQVQTGDDGDGKIEEFVGGFSDYAAFRKAEAEEAAEPRKRETKPAAPASEKPSQPRAKLSYKDQRALDTLPDTIDKLGTEIEALGNELANPDLFTGDPKRFKAASARLEAAQAELEDAENRWLELEELRETIEKARAS